MLLVRKNQTLYKLPVNILIVFSLFKVSVIAVDEVKTMPNSYSSALTPVTVHLASTRGRGDSC